jgi:hypothetical protein
VKLVMIDCKGENCVCEVMLYEMWKGTFQTFTHSAFFCKIVTNLKPTNKMNVPQVSGPMDIKSSDNKQTIFICKHATTCICVVTVI